jgi:hypothetical protein
VLWLAAALGVGCAHAPVPRLVLAGRLTARGERVELAGTAMLRAPLEVPTPPTRGDEGPYGLGPAGLPTGLPVLPPDAARLATRPGEPDIEAVLERVLASGALDPARAADARERARWSGLLPILRADVRRGSGWDLRTQQSGASDTAILASDDSWSVIGSATLRLDRLVFAREETSLLAEERRLEEARLRLVSEVVRLYFERRRLQAERDARGETDLATEARIAELGAVLDALTGGALTDGALIGSARAGAASGEDVGARGDR